MAGPLGPHGPMDRMGRWDDPELADIFRDDADLYELARTVRASRPEPVAGPHFEPYLRARLMDEATRQLRPRGLGRWLRPRPGILAGGGAALGLAMIAAVVVTTVMYHPNDSVKLNVSANVAENHYVDPGDIIRVSFNVPVDHTAIERNLQFHPATSVQTRWDGTTLVITPLHHLAANTPYSVTIPKTAVLDEKGHGAATADIHITFGTASTPTPAPTSSPATPPTLQPQSLGPVSGDSRVLIAPDGTVVATSGLVVAATPTPAPGATSQPSASGLPGTASLLPGLHTGQSRSTPTPRPASSPTPSGASTSALLQLGGANGPTTLGPAATTAAYSPSGRLLAYLVAHGASADVVVAHADGSSAAILTHNADATSPLAWSGEDHLVYLSSREQVSSVDLYGHGGAVGGGVSIGEGQDLALAPRGQVAYVGPVPTAVPTASPTSDVAGTATPSASATPSPQSLGHLVDLASGTIRPLQGIRQLPAFSADGSTVSWIDESGSTPVLEVMATGDPGASPRTVPTDATGGDTLGNLALSGDATRLAYTVSHGNGTPVLRVVTVSTAATLAVGDGLPVASPVLSGSGDRIAFVRATPAGVVAAEAVIPGVTPSYPAADSVPPDASAVLDKFIDAQRTNTASTLRTLAAPSLSFDPSLTPGGITRTYVIKAALDQQTQTVTADVRLVRDATDNRATSFADETVKLARPAAGQPFQVTVVTVGAFAGPPAGPQVVHVSTERDPLAALVVRISFDSDLTPGTVTGSVISLTTGSGVALPMDVRYDVESRTAVIRLLTVPAGSLTLAVGTGLQDIAGQNLASGYVTTVQG